MTDEEFKRLGCGDRVAFIMNSEHEQEAEVVSISGNEITVEYGNRPKFYTRSFDRFRFVKTEMIFKRRK
jgi:hypothetical protein